MGEIFFPVSGVDFSELRQIALTFCHSFVNRLHSALTILSPGVYQLNPHGFTDRFHRIPVIHSVLVLSNHFDRPCQPAAL